ncbi:flagellar export chaperone FliS [Nevskia sp.]|uniref:flagellar export chaperone FliS n=1 Tax=Nevskia sp. TaxID=1929292 RepID=UPI0026000E85|nr:flagellar export chaperone FliS [Nevskia sp.]
MAHYMNSAMNQYRQTGIAAATVETDPRKLIEMLLGGAIERLAHARGAMLRQEREAKHHYLGSAMSIIEHLRVVLDLKAGGALAANLMRLYDYMLGRLPAANLADDTAAIDEVISLLRELKSGWDAMPGTSTRH